MFNIDVGGSLSLNLMLGKIEASGSFKYIEEKTRIIKVDE